MNLLLFLSFELTFCTYTTLDGSKLISLSYFPNEDYDASELVSSDNINQEMYHIIPGLLHMDIVKTLTFHFFAAKII